MTIQAQVSECWANVYEDVPGQQRVSTPYLIREDAEFVGFMNVVFGRRLVGRVHLIAKRAA